MAVDYFLKKSSKNEIEKFKKSESSYCMIKENGIWKACSAVAVFEYLNQTGSLQLITEKVNSDKFYDVLSIVQSGVRQYREVN